MPMVTCSETVVLGAGGVRGPGGQVHAQSRLEQHLLDARPGGCTSHCLAPAVWKTKTSWVSECTAKPCEPGGVR